MNQEVSGPLIDSLTSSIRKTRVEFSRMMAIGILGPLVLIQVLRLAGADSFLASDSLAGSGSKNSIAIWTFGLTYILASYPYWRMRNGNAYVAHYLIRAIRRGLDYQAQSISQERRDDFADAIQMAATRYRVIYRRVNSVRIFSKQVKATARRCRDNIMSMIPCIVTADADQVAEIVTDLARLLIRSQTGYWHQTNDIARSPVTRHWTDRARQQVTDFLLDRSVQIAILAAIASLIAALVALLGKGYIK
ncbi:hypothetical protein J4573_08670 [Actinomadura barringtoniae]|uniref:Uncharacterized protein n=1 Tax=Actinomadura barringtoniae TaxID=1427535 RepID=A0A939T5I9_9ACTN|nr:hypothetical protein [Actinomadura barringtoniae]MBO2447157.1 hypothetical protein [Actinomadura barringtoniae]